MDDHDLLIRIDERMERVEDMLDGGKEMFRTHDDRIRDIEQNQSKFIGVVIAVGSLVTIGLNAVLYLLGKLWK